MTGRPDPSALPCPCGLGLPYAQCCGRWHAAFAADGTLGAPTAEALMRSRFTAFARLGAADPSRESTSPGAGDPTRGDGVRTVRAMVDYLRATWAAEMRPCAADLTPSTAAPAALFMWLAVEETQGGGPFDAVGTVTFTALGRHAASEGAPAGGASGARFRLREQSRFRREDGVWRYVDGDVAG